MLALDIVFLIFIGIATMISIILLLTPVKNKVIDFFINSLEKEKLELKECNTIFLKNFEDLDKLCEYCEKLGKEIKRPCICYVVYSENVTAKKCKMNCNIKNNKIWLISYYPSGTEIIC
jgi:hypothetical protein